ncbi:MAG: cytochrome-c oxidase, cbb3-type subunit III [Pseudomonadales bacterium]
MSDLVALFVIVGTLGSLLTFFLVLHFNRTTGNKNQTTGHSYDGIEEYDNPLPSWWYWKFVLTIVFALGYLVYYPGLGNWQGISGWTSVGEYEKDQAAAEAKYGPIYAQFNDLSLDEVAANPEALNMGRRLYANNCSVCHGAEGKGSLGFPNLTDSDWLWGGSDEQIKTTLMQGRIAAMPPWISVLGEQGVQEAAEYVLKISGADGVDEALATAGEAHYQSLCVACHGPNGKGNTLMGAPNLTDDIWLYGGSRDLIRHNLRFGLNGRMPAFAEKLGPDRVHIVAGYVRSLSDEQ